MIYTITLNPAFDCTLYTDKFVVNEANHYQQSSIAIGGKGINVALILNRLGDPVTAVGLFGNENVEPFVKKFNQEQLKHHLIKYPGTTRTNYKIKNLKAQEETELDGLSTFIPTTTLKALFSYLDTKLQANDIVVVGGSIPRGLKPLTYFQLGQLIHEKKAIFMLDGTRDPLDEGLKAKPYLIKPNLVELKDTFGWAPKSSAIDDLIPVIKSAAQKGAENVLLSMGGGGSYFFASDGAIFKVGIAQGKLMNSVGAGDSMLAGFIHGMVNHLPIEETLKYAAASGGATAFSEELGSKTAIMAYQPKIKVEALKGIKWK